MAIKMARMIWLASCAALSGGAQALDLSPGGAFVQLGAAEHATHSLGAGVLWPWSWRREGLGGEWTGLTEGSVAYWTSRGSSGRNSFAQLGLLPLVRYRFAQGRSDWFLEAGIGITVMDRPYRTALKQFSTRFNFNDVVGIGYSFGAQRQRELSLRLAHMSNAGIKEPNPGENFVQLRYAAWF